MATIEVRGGTFRARVRRNGAPSLSRSFDTREDAMAWASATEAAVRAGRYGELQRGTSTLSDCIGGYLLSPKLAGQKAAASTGRVLRQLQRDPVARFSAENLSPADIAAFVDRRQRSGASGSTINRSLAALSTVVKWAGAKRGVRFAADLFTGQRLPENKARTRRLQPGELERILAHCDAHMAAYVQLAVETAMRRGEMAGALVWEQVDLRRRSAHLPTTKNGDSRTVPLSSRAVAILERMPRPLVGGRVFPHHPDRYSHLFIDACKKAGIDGLRLHDLRAEAISRRAEQGLPLADLKALSGHKSAIIMRYLRSGSVEELAQRLG